MGDHVASCSFILLKLSWTQLSSELPLQDTHLLKPIFSNSQLALRKRINKHGSIPSHNMIPRFQKSPDSAISLLSMSVRSQEGSSKYENTKMMNSMSTFESPY